jgi:hypothetical protein
MRGGGRGGSGGRTSQKLCHVELPTYTSDVTCAAYALSFEPTVWDGPESSWREIASKPEPLQPNGTMLSHGPIALSASDDLEMDGEPGLTLSIRDDGSTFVSELDSGLCSSGINYRYSAVFTEPAPGGIGAVDKHQRVFAELDVALTGHAQLSGDCTSLASATAMGNVSIAPLGCAITLTDRFLVPPGDREQLDDMRYRCNEQDLDYLLARIPEYQPLAEGEQPGETNPPLGWSSMRETPRDIDRTASAGPQVVFYRIGDLSIPEPNCENARHAFELP